jgi:MoaA/NifB/PqqE/SkfB family radical SAM enzyme
MLGPHNKSEMVSHSQIKIRLGPPGVHLFSRRTGLNVLCDELQVPALLWAHAPAQVSIALTNRCDLSCPHCYAPKNRASLDAENLLQWIRDLDKNGCLGIGFGGGEPTLHPSFADLCRRAACETDLAVTFTTHGHRIDDTLIKALRGNVHFVRVSVDGLGRTYELIRKKSFATLVSQLERIFTLAPFGINFVVNALTFPELDAAIEFAAEVHATEFLLLPEQPTNGHAGADKLTLQALREWIVSYKGRMPLAISEVAADFGGLYPIFLNEKGLRAYAHIDASGILKRSSYDHDGIAIGSDGVMAALRLLHSSPRVMT